MDRAMTGNDPARNVPLVLCVEDEPLLRQSLARLLRRAGAEVVSAANGEEALAWLGRGPRPDLVLTDLHMPVLGGEELLRSIRHDPALSRIPVIAMSGTPTGEAFDLFLGKPFGLVELRAALLTFWPARLARRGQGRAPPQPQRQ